MGKNNKNYGEYEKLINPDEIEMVGVTFNFRKQVVDSIVATIKQKKATHLVINYRNEIGSLQTLEVPIPEKDSARIATYVKIQKRTQNKTSSFAEKCRRSETLIDLYHKALSLLDKHKEQQKKRENSLPVKSQYGNDQKPITLNFTANNGQNRKIIVHSSNRNYPSLKKKYLKLVKSQRKLAEAENKYIDAKSEKKTFKAVVYMCKLQTNKVKNNVQKERLGNKSREIINSCINQPYR